MRAHIIENGLVINTIEVDSLDFMPNLVEATSGSIGWKFDGSTFIEPEPIASPAEPTKEELLMQLQALQAQIQALA